MHLLTQVSGELEKVKIGEYVLTPPETHNRLSKDWYFNIKHETGDEIKDTDSSEDEADAVAPKPCGIGKKGCFIM